MSQPPESPFDLPPDEPPAGSPGKPPVSGGPAQGGPVEPLETDADARNMAMLCHLLGVFLGIFGPLIIWLIKKDESPFVDEQGKEAVNFHITLLIAYVATSVAWVVISLVTCGFGSLLFLPVVVGVAQLVLGILAAMDASQGKHYRYPYNYRWIQ